MGKLVVLFAIPAAAVAFAFLGEVPAWLVTVGGLSFAGLYLQKGKT